MVNNRIDKINEKTSNQIHDNNKVQQHQQQTKILNPKFIPRSTKTLILSDSKYKKVQAKDLSPSTAIHSYPSAKVQGLSNIVKQYNNYHKIEKFIIDAGHNNIDSGNSGFETASILMETASEIINKFLPLEVALCKIPPAKEGFFGRSKNNENIDKNNEALENVATELSGVFDIDVVFLNNRLETKDMNNDGVHPSVSHGLLKLVRNIRNFYVHLGPTVSESEIKPRIINRIFGKNFDHYDNNNFFGFHPKQAFLPPTHYKFG